MRTSGHQSGEMGHIDKIERTHFVRDLPHAGKINDSRVSAASTDNQLRSFLVRQPFQIIIVNGLSFLGHSIRNDAISLAREIQMMAVGEVASVREVKPQDGIARL